MPSATHTCPSPSTAMPLGRAKYPGPSPALPNVRMNLPSASKISTRSFHVSVTYTVAILVDRNIGRLREISGRSKRVRLPAGSDLAQQLVRRIGVIDQHLVQVRIGHIQETILVIDGQPRRTRQPFADAAFRDVLAGSNTITRRISLSEANKRSLSSIANPVISPKRASTPFLISCRSFVSVSKMKMA